MSSETRQQSSLERRPLAIRAMQTTSQVLQLSKQNSSRIQLIKQAKYGKNLPRVVQIAESVRYKSGKDKKLVKSDSKGSRATQPAKSNQTSPVV